MKNIKAKIVVYKVLLKIFRATNLIKLIPDKEYLKMNYMVLMNESLDLKSPKTFNQKLQWLKIYDRNPKYTTMVDKLTAKKYVASVVGEEYIIPTLGVWESFDDIDFDSLPNEFVLKATHDSGGIVICKNKSTFNLEEAKTKLEKSLKHNYFWNGREWPYKNVKPRIIAEKYIESLEKDELMDYKLMCFNGKHKVTFVCSERFSENGLKVTFFDKDWNVMPYERRYHKRSKTAIMRPKSYEKMIEIAEKLSTNIPFLRVDFYEIQGKLLFGELTFYPSSGFESFVPSGLDQIMGDWLALPNRNDD